MNKPGSYKEGFYHIYDRDGIQSEQHSISQFIGNTWYLIGTDQFYTNEEKTFRVGNEVLEPQTLSDRYGEIK